MITQPKISPYAFPGFVSREMIHSTSKSKRIIAVVSQISGISYTKMCEKTRRTDIVLSRQLCMYFMRYHTQHSLKEIGAYFGGFDHTTVIHSATVIQEYIDTKHRRANLYIEAVELLTNEGII